jgi:hypothetical protein
MTESLRGPDHGPDFLSEIDDPGRRKRGSSSARRRGPASRRIGRPRSAITAQACKFCQQAARQSARLLSRHAGLTRTLTAAPTNRTIVRYHRRHHACTTRHRRVDNHHPDRGLPGSERGKPATERGRPKPPHLAVTAGLGPQHLVVLVLTTITHRRKVHGVA